MRPRPNKKTQEALEKLAREKREKEMKGWPFPEKEVKSKGVTPSKSAEYDRPVFNEDPAAKAKVRVSARVGEDGQLWVKIYRDGVLVSESSGHPGGTVTVEIEA
jgi:hypothetical protein